MKLPFLSKKTNTSSWPWPSCHQPRTLSFRNTTTITTTMFKTINSAYIDAETITDSSLFNNTSSSESTTASFSTASEDCSSGDPIETVIRGLRSERLFFEPGLETSSILEEAKSTTSPFKESLVLSMESQDPYIDFKKSMEEMVEAHGLKDWEDLEELLCWYLRMNVKTNHGYIVGAFVDLLVALALAFASTTTTTSSSSNGDNFITSSSSSLTSNISSSLPLSFYTSSDDCFSTPCCLSSLLEAEAEDDKIVKQQKDDEAYSS